MTKEELEKEAEVYAKNLLFVFETDIVQRIVRERVRLALIDVLEQREKRIEELEKENAELKKCSTKAKKILKTIADNWQGSRVNTDKNRMIHKAFNDAEMFFKEIKEK